ncbi:hypothetical protein KP509_32G050100 [Ceratopteris richardii]|uniref:Uncharacterized protein n=1 Tax=Ceratopteris richardii TaxID=49495 RepID=A0A8T2QTV1_CERRI|nr:hypothetical protein KP509_32G050100 [Ceratopteris richardii]
MNFEDDEEWDLDLLDKLVQSEEQAIAARRGVSSTPIPFSSLPPHPPPLSHSLRLVVSQPPEKQDDSTVFDLQQRLRQAELELSELQRKAQQNTAAASSATVEDQEILQVKRTCVEKSEQLKRLNTENEELRKHLEEIKRFKWEEGSNTGVVRKDCKESETRNLKSSLAENQIANQDLWYPPWAPTVSTADGSKSKSASPQDGPQRKNSSIDSQKLDSQFQSRVVHHQMEKSRAIAMTQSKTRPLRHRQHVVLSKVEWRLMTITRGAGGTHFCVLC